VPDDHDVVDHYGSHYGQFAADVHAQVRRDAFGEDIGQNSWQTAGELERFLSWVELRPSGRLLDVGCGSGGPALHVARLTGCEVVGVDFDAQGVAHGNQTAREAGLADRARFVQADAHEPLPFEDGFFDVILSVDVINHLRDRPRVLADWARLLRPGGRLVFTDSATVTGPLGSDEIAIRASIGYFLFVPAKEDERLLAEAGLVVLSVEDTTSEMAEVAGRRLEARRLHERDLRPTEGDHAFEGRQRFFEVSGTLARERRLSRLAYLAEKPATKPTVS
jgi:SAM-dependent methyltransferase